MKRVFLMGLLFFASGVTIHLLSQPDSQTTDNEKSIQALKSPYLGQPFPGLLPVLFPPPELRATHSWFYHGSPVFSPNQNEMFFVKMYDLPGSQWLEINYIEKVNGQWTEPQVAAFANTQYGENNPFYSEDGNILYFLSHRPGGGIFKVTRESQGWSALERLNIPIPAGYSLGGQFAIVRNGTVYFELWGPGGNPPDLYRSKLVNGQYRTPVHIDTINTEYNEFSPYVDPEEKYMIFDSNRPGGSGLHDLYFSFRHEDGTWSEARNLGSEINTYWEEVGPSMSPDGKYFFFTAVKSGDIGYSPYWVDARSLGIIDAKVFGHADYNADGRADLAVFNPKTRIWNIKDQFKRKFGRKDSIPTPGDYNGDGKTDLSYYCRAKRIWKVRKSVSVKNFGGINSIPVPADYDGDGKTDIAVFNTYTSLWEIRESSRKFKKSRIISFGEWGDIPVPGDYNGDGVCETAVFRPMTGEWIIDGSDNVRYGLGTDLPVPADYNGDGKTDIATWDPYKGKWNVYRQFKKKYGKYGDIPVPGDYDGDGKVDLAVFDPSSGIWKVRKQFEATHGKPGEIPLVKGN